MKNVAISIFCYLFPEHGKRRILKSEVKSDQLILVMSTSRDCFSGILDIFNTISYLDGQKASQIRLFQPCFFKQAVTSGKIGSNFGHFGQYLRFSFRSRFLLLSGTLSVEKITSFDWSRKQQLFTLGAVVRKRRKYKLEFAQTTLK